MKAVRLFALVALATAACYPPPREVRRTATGGELALAFNNNDTREEAGKLMTARCPNGYDILEEGEVVVGQVSNTQTQENTQHGRAWGSNRPVTQTSGSQTTTTEDKREWRILYQCKGVAGAPVADPAAADPAQPSNVLIPARSGEIHEVRYQTY